MRPSNQFALIVVIVLVIKVEIRAHLENFIDANLKNYKKCCTKSDYLVKSNDSLRCKSFRRQNFEVYSKRTFNDLESSCENDECVDFLFDETRNSNLVKIKACDLYENLTDFVYLPKCCPLSHQYDSSRHHCVEKAGFALNVSFQVLHLSMDKCPNNTHAVRDYKESFMINEKREVHLKEIGKIFPSGAYCIDTDASDGNWIVRSCEKYSNVCQYSIKSSGVPCLRKCCPDGKVYQVPGGCVIDYDNQMDIATSSRVHLKNDSTYAIIHTDGKKRFALEEDEFFVNQVGTVHMNKNSQWLRFPSAKVTYCIENFIFPGENFTMGDFVIVDTFKERPWLKIIACLTSTFFLLLTIICYLFLPEAKNLHGKSILMHCFILCLGFATLAFSIYYEFVPGSVGCPIIGFGILFTMLGAFSWLNIICFDMWTAFGTLRVLDVNNKRRERRKFFLYNLYGWGLPVSITSAAFFIYKTRLLPDEFVPKIGDTKCFFDFGTEGFSYDYLIFFLLPLTLMVFANCVFFYFTIRYCYRVKNEIQKMKNRDKARKRKFKDDNEKMMMLLKLFLLMGVSWLFEILSTFVFFRNHPFLEFVESAWDTFNSAQGLFIFAIFILKRSVYISIKEKLGWVRVRKASECSLTTSTNLTSSSGGRNNGTT